LENFNVGGITFFKKKLHGKEEGGGGGRRRGNAGRAAEKERGKLVLKEGKG